MKLRTLSLLLLGSLAACSKSSTGPVVQPSIAGSWNGTSAGGFIVAFTILETSHQIQGNGTITASGNPALGLTISGTHLDSTFSLNLVNAAFQSVFYTGTVRGGQLHGVMNNSGFSNE